MVGDGGLAAVGVLVGGGGLATVGGLVVETEARAKAVGKFGGALVEVGAIEDSGIARAAGDFKSGRKRDLRVGDKDRRKKREKKEKRFFIGFPREPHG